MAETNLSSNWKLSWKTWARVESALQEDKRPKAPKPDRSTKAVDSKARDWAIEWYSTIITGRHCSVTNKRVNSRYPRMFIILQETPSRTSVRLRFHHSCQCLSTWWLLSWVLSPRPSTRTNRQYRRTTTTSPCQRPTWQTARTPAVNSTCSTPRPPFPNSDWWPMHRIGNSRSRWSGCEMEAKTRRRWRSLKTSKSSYWSPPNRQIRSRAMWFVR